MKFGYPICDNCVCGDVCRYRQDINLFREDMMHLNAYGDKTYAQILSPVIVELKCQNYMSKSK